MVRFRVFSQKDLTIIINHFDKYPLLTQKRTDFKFLNKVFLMVKNKEHLTWEGFRK